MHLFFGNAEIVVLFLNALQENRTLTFTIKSLSWSPEGNRKTTFGLYCHLRGLVTGKQSVGLPYYYQHASVL